MKSYINDYTRLNLNSLKKEAEFWAKGRKLLFEYEVRNKEDIYLTDLITGIQYLYNGVWQIDDEYYQLFYDFRDTYVGISAKKYMN